MNDVPLDQLTLRQFSELVGTRFRVSWEATSHVELELVEAKDRTAGDPRSPADGRARYESFSLLFAGPAEPLLAQRICRFEHERVGRFDLFIVPLGRNRQGAQYEAVFNRLVPRG